MGVHRKLLLKEAFTIWGLYAILLGEGEEEKGT